MEFISDIYPEATEFTSIASHQNPLFIRDKNNNIRTKVYDKCDGFGFHTVSFPFKAW